MKAIKIDEFVQSIDELAVKDADIPRVHPDTVLVKIHYCGLNYVDFLYVQGLHQNNRRHVKPPFVAGQEFSGVVAESNSASFKPGDRVFGASLGAFADYVLVPASAIRCIPSSWQITLREAAGIAATAPVSYAALVHAGRMQRNDVVLVHGAAGGLGVFAVQIAKAIGCRVIATIGSASKAQILTKIGVASEDVINYSHQGWETTVMKRTNGKGVNLVFDSVGLVRESIRCAAHNARILVIGFAGRQGDLESIPVNRVLLKSIQLIGYRFGESMRQNPDDMQRVWSGLSQMFERGLRPVVYNKTFNGLDSVSAAMRELQDRKVWGKAVVNIAAHTNKGPKL